MSVRKEREKERRSFLLWPRYDRCRGRAMFGIGGGISIFRVKWPICYLIETSEAAAGAMNMFKMTMTRILSTGRISGGNKQHWKSLFHAQLRNCDGHAVAANVAPSSLVSVKIERLSICHEEKKKGIKEKAARKRRKSGKFP